MFGLDPGIVDAVAAALLFGGSLPLAKLLAGEISPVLLAGLLYLGSGTALLGFRVLRRLLSSRGTRREAGIALADLPVLAAAILSGGIVAPVLFMVGLRSANAANASLLLNFENVFTALLAWFVFRENFDRRIALGMIAIVVAGTLLAWPGPHGTGNIWGLLAVAGACLAWAIDNNLTRKISARDPVQIAAAKGLVAGTVNIGIGLFYSGALPGIGGIAGALAVGAAGYGISLMLYVLALRRIGAARTGAYFALAPFVGAGTAIAVLKEHPGALFWPAATLMAFGVWLHLSERHEHAHQHDATTHDHGHRHDEHHQHTHDFPWDGNEPHAHPHFHPPLSHSHRHYPDLHHRHRH
ncbi:MAG: DMT family transporter [Acidiferrobacterales bacterium]